MPSRPIIRKNRPAVPAGGNLNLVLLHGYAETPNGVWFPWLHRRAEDRGWRIWAPILPGGLKPEYSVWLKMVRAQARTWDRNTVIVGHSLGGVVGLRALAESVRTVRAVITVSAPFGSPVPVGQMIRFFADPMDWPALRRRAGEFITVHAKNDPLIPYDAALRYRELLKSRLILTEKDGHFNIKQIKIVWDELERIAAREIKWTPQSKYRQITNQQKAGPQAAVRFFFVGYCFFG